MFDNFKYYRNQLKSELKYNPSLPLSCKIQTLLQMFGIAIHNPFRDECCSDFECCTKTKHNRCWLHIGKNHLPIHKEITYEPTAPVGTPDREFIKKSKIKFF